MIVDHLDNIYVVDFNNHRIMCWSKESKQSRVIVDENESGQQLNELSYFKELLFDRQD
jgi:hypothetical protein